MNVEVVKEIRFAVVMYGGVSLAIYINGVAQELLQMVRATAVNADADKFQFAESDLEGSAHGYRMLSYLLGDQKLLRKFAPQIKDKVSWETVQKEMLTEIKQQSSVKIVRFVVDILSGSSAGGINAIYLSKALTGGQKLKTLEDFWIKEGDFSGLLDDEKSLNETNLTLPKNRTSLFNSQRMYLKLVEAFENIDSAENNPVTSSMVDEVDLFVTLTDFWGLPIPVRLFDKIINERNYRRRLHFKFRRDGDNDFEKENYPFLAFAARCSSSFPVAFEPMKLSDTTAVLQTKSPKVEMPADWTSYFPLERIQQFESPIDWKNRVFVDGGVLDNKPFGYAIEALAQRQADVLIDRKLVYVEPKPDLDGGIERVGWTQRPDALKNTINIVTTLPGYETIREDLQKVLDRNRLIERVGYLVSNARKDEYRVLDLAKDDLQKVVDENSLLGKSRQNKNWAELTLAEIAREKGQAVYPYYRLRLSALTDDLAALATRRAGFDDTSDYFLAIRSLVRAWRLKNYNKDENKGGEKTISTFLYEFDFNYRLRRLRFVLQEADRLLSALDALNGKSFAASAEADFQKDKFAADLKLRFELTQKIKSDGNFKDVIASEKAREILRQKFSLVESELFEMSAESPDEKIFSADKEDLRRILSKFKKAINISLKELSRRQHSIERRLSDEYLPKQFEQLNEKFAAVAALIKVEDLAKLLGETEGQNTVGDYNLETADQQVTEYLKANGKTEDGIIEIAEVLRRIYNGETNSDGQIIDEEKTLFGKLRRQSEKLFSPKTDRIPSLEKAVCGYLRHFHKNFDSYDQIIFPITFETPVGEGDTVEVARISPADAVNLINEEKDSQKRKKLAGDSFFSFSAFFNDDWRRNDIMWGRLDAVERLVGVVSPENAPENDSRFIETIITEIQRGILKDHKAFLGIENEDPIKFIKDKYKVNRSLNENSIMKTTARALAIGTKILQSPTEKPANNVGIIRAEKPAMEKPNKWLVRSARMIDLLQNMVEVSSYDFSLKNFFTFLVLPFRMGWMAIPFLIFLMALFGFWLIVFTILFLLDDRANYLGISKPILLLIAGAFFGFGSFYALLFALMYWLKGFITRQLTKEIIGA